MPHRSLVEGSNRGELPAMASCLLLGAMLLCAATVSVLARSPLQQEGSAGAALPASLQPSAASHITQSAAAGVQQAHNATSAAAALPLVRSEPQPESGALAASHGHA